MISNRYLILGSAIAMALAILGRLPGVIDEANSLVSKQEASNEKLVEWKQAYQALLPVNKQWIVTFRAAVEAKDLLSIYKLFELESYGLAADIDLLQQVSASEVLVNGASVGLQKVCVGLNSTGIELTSSSLAQLRSGIKLISMRRDIELGSIEYSYSGKGESGHYLARIAPFCLIVRTDTESGGGA